MKGFAVRKIRKRVRKVLISVLIWVVATIWFSPVFWMLSTSFKATLAALSESVPRWLPSPATMENYKIIFNPLSGVNVVSAFRNSLLVASAVTLAVLVIVTPAAYALARLSFRGRSAIFWSYVTVLAFPPSIFLVPNFLIIRALGLMNTFWALMLPTFGGTFGVFLLRQYMLGIPRELEDAAWVDGCSKLRFLVSVVIPLIRPALLTLALMTFLGSWNSFLWPLLVLTSPDKFTLPIALVRFRGEWNDPFRGVGPTMAAAFLAVGPVILIFFLFRRYLMRGISLGGIGK